MKSLFPLELEKVKGDYFARHPWEPETFWRILDTVAERMLQEGTAVLTPTANPFVCARTLPDLGSNFPDNWTTI